MDFQLDHGYTYKLDDVFLLYMLPQYHKILGMDLGICTQRKLYWMDSLHQQYIQNQYNLR